MLDSASPRSLTLPAASPILAMAKEAARLRSEGRDIVDLTLGEPDLPPPDHVIREAREMAGRPLGYSPANGIPQLRDAITRTALRESGIAYGDDQVAVGCGAKQIIFNTFMASLQPGDEVIVPAPYWASYPDMVTMFGATPVIVLCGADDGFKISASALRAAITKQTRWFVLNSPSNPTGATYSVEELQDLASVLRDHPRIMVLSDEIYGHIHYGEGSVTSLAVAAPDLRDRILVVNGVSKAYAMTGWRVGWALGATDLISRITTVQSQNCTQTSTLSQHAAVAALDGPQEFLAERLDIYNSRRAVALDILNGSPHLNVRSPEGAFYLFFRLPYSLNDRMVANALLNSGVATVFGSAFGAPGYIRISFATDIETLREGCLRLVSGVARLVDDEL